MTTLTVDGRSTLINKDDPEYEQFIKLGEKLSLGMIPPEVSNPQMELLKTVTMGALPVEIQERFEDTWNGKYYLHLEISGSNQILFRWKSTWVYGNIMNAENEWFHEHVGQDHVLSFFMNKRTKYHDFESEKIISDVKEKSEKGLKLRYTLSDLVLVYKYDPENDNLTWMNGMAHELASFARKWIYERDKFEYYTPV